MCTGFRPEVARHSQPGASSLWSQVCDRFRGADTHDSGALAVQGQRKVLLYVQECTMSPTWALPPVGGPEGPSVHPLKIIAAD